MTEASDGTHCIDLLTCPLCGAGFMQEDRALKCANRHAFDIAREGYVNLLLGKARGDTREMLLARRNFLERDHYRPLSQAINEHIYQYLGGRAGRESEYGGCAILDVGCGEGYYSGNLVRNLEQRLPATHIRCLGLDISKDAVKMAARRAHAGEGCFVVADVTERLVVADRSLHVLLNIFAPRNPAEFARVVVPGGMLLIAIPGPSHLLSLRSTLKLLDIEKDKQRHVVAQFQDLFTLVTVSPVTYELHLHSQDIVNAVKMTPNYWHMSEQNRAAAEGIELLHTEAEFTCLIFLRSEG
ncbi:MAG: methyltransferase domain-containing protein [Ktedonobacteraceae bacterium]|nr:methyltransferase domain-containing protein [Ktedonobacteraceae bacterium]